MPESFDARQINAQTTAIKENLAAVQELTANKLQPVLQRQRQELRSFQEDVNGIFKNVFSGIERDLNRTLDFRTILQNGLERTLTQIEGVISQTITQSLQQAIAGASSGSGSSGVDGLANSLGKVLSGIFGGARASGGPVLPNQAFLVGEQGPELFIPNTAGHISPSARQQGNVNIVMQISTPDAGSFRNSQGQIIAEAAQALQRARRNL